MNRCSICHTRVEAPSATTACPECEQIYHCDCWEGLGGCATYGCARVAVAEKPPLPEFVGAGWGDTKTCPACDASIGASLLVCRCGAEFPSAEPMSHKEYRTSLDRASARRGTRRAITVLSLATMLGVTAPFLGPVSGYLAWKHRHALGGADGTYLALGYGAAALGATYTVFLVLMLAGL